MKNKRISLLLLGVVGLVGKVFADELPKILKYDRDPITFGCTVRLKHALTGKYLTADDERYDHPGTSGQFAVYGGTDDKTEKAQWIIKGRHSGDRWNFALNRDIANRSMIGWPVRKNQGLRFENVATGRDLHSHGARSPRTAQREVTAYGENGNGDTNDNFVVDQVDAAGGFEYLANGYKAKFRHENGNWTLHSHSIEWKPGKQEITTFGGRDDNDWWFVEIVAQPNKSEKIKSIYDKTRSAQLSYWAPLFWDTETDGCDEKYGEHRVWTHGGNRHDPAGNAQPPHDHLELILGPWGDSRVQQGPSFFVMHNADDKFKTGPIQFGDRIKIMSTFGGAGEDDKKGLLLPFRYLWMLEQSRFGTPHREIVISRPEHGGTQDDSAIFVLEPIIVGQTGPVSSLDLVRIRNVKTNAYFWMHPQNRWGHRYWEILADKGSEDRWGRDHYGTERRVFWEKFRFSLALPATVASDVARTDLAAVNREIEGILGAVKAKETQAHLEVVAKSNEELVKLLKKQKEDAEKAEAERIKAANEQIAKAKADADAALEALKTASAADKKKAQDEVDAAKKAIEALEADKKRAAQALADAQQAAEDAKKQVAEDAKKKVSEAELKAKIDADKAALFAADLMRKLDLPVGFVTMPGKVRSAALGLQDRETEVAVDNRGTKRKIVSFDDFGVVVLDDGSLGQLSLSTDPANPWQRVPLADEKGVAIKVSGAAVGTDGTTFVISQDGKSLYGITWPGDTPAAMPQASKGFEASDAKGAHRREKAKRRGSKKDGKKGKKGEKHKKTAGDDLDKKDVTKREKKDSSAKGRGKGGRKHAEGKKSQSKKKHKGKKRADDDDDDVAVASK